MTLAELFKKQRVALNMTQKEISDRMRLTSSQFISNFERGLTPLPLERVTEAIKILKLDKQKVFYLLMKEHEKYLNNYFK